MKASAPAERNNRILVVDDNRAIHEDFRKILSDPDPLQVAEARLLGNAEAVCFRVDSEEQGEGGLRRVQEALAEGRPYAVAFVDVRMPPGWDGVETTRRIWEVDPDLQIVICTAYSDYSWSDISEALGQSDRLLILKKPFDPIEVVQLAHALTDKWRLLQDSRRTLADCEQVVSQRTSELDRTNAALRVENEQRRAVEAMLQREQDALEERVEERTRTVKESEQRYRFLADSMPQMIWTATPDGNMDYYNQRWYDYTGLTFEQSKDWGWESVLHPDDRNIRVERWSESFTTGSDYQVECRFKRAADGAYRWHLGRAFPMRDDQGTIVHWVGTCTDIDDYKRAQESLRDAHENLERRVTERTTALNSAKRKLQAVLDAATQVAIVATDTDGLITVFNSGAERMFGYTAWEIVGKHTPARFHLESEILERGRELSELSGRLIAGCDVFFDAARHGKSEAREWTLVRKDGSRLTAILGVTALRDADGELVGFLGVVNDISDRKRTEIELAQFRAELEERVAGAAIANDSLQRQTEELRRLNEERAALGNMNELLPACANAGEAYEIFGRAAAGLFPSLTGVLHVYAASRNRLTPAAVWGQWPEAALPTSPEGCWGLRRGKAYLGNRTSTPPCGHAGAAPGLATLCVPLMAYGEVLGVAHLRGSNAAAVQSALPLASMAGDALALTLANLGLRESLKSQSIRDPLTDLFNRRYMTEILEREFARAQRSGAPIAVVMLDVDHFKRFNDTFGHDAGDAVLRELGKLLKRSIRVEDVACRYGGEEFCLVLPQMDRDGAGERAELVRKLAAKLEVELNGHAIGPVTLSLGVALFPEDAGTITAVLAAADAALYQAKREGRNRVVLCQPVNAPGVKLPGEGPAIENPAPVPLSLVKYS